jgi:carboxyl-terminal processing protease
MRNPLTRRAKIGATLVLLIGGLTAFYLQKPSTVASARLFQQVLQIMSMQYVDTVPTDSLYARAARGLIKELNDPYTVLFTPKEMEQFTRQMGGQYAGIGTAISKVENHVVIMKVFPNTPAARAGVLEGDKIFAIDSVEVQGWTDQQVSDKLRGPAGTTVNVKFLRDGVAEPVSIQITRELVHIPAVPYAMVLDGNVGYIPLQQFGSSAAQEVGEAIERVTKQGATKIVLDLRGNGGGLTDQAVKISNYFLPKNKVVVSMRGRTGAAQSFATNADPTHPEVPLIVLVNGQSASASEIVAGALQDHDRAVIIGSTTFGKGSAQGIFQLDGGYALKMTTQKWYTPLGRSIQKERVLTDDGRYVEVHPDSLESDSARKARPQFKTDAGRVILGGGGITPDLVVTGSELDSKEQKLVEAIRPKAGLFNAELNAYALEYRNKVKPDFAVTPKMREEFLARLQKKGLTIDKAVLSGAMPYMDRLIGLRISTLAFGDSTTKQKYLSEDAQLLKAVSMLKVAQNQKTLFTIAAKENERNAVASR